MAKTTTTKKTAAPKAQSVEDLRAALATKEADLLGYRRGLAAGELKNNSIIKTVRKDIARLKTELTMDKISKEGEK